ncbi:hypothetical protein HZS_2393 [Henneguya salminicola]|nr:hypothetical protein HZS_2393 [Henneguya salminicola]
MSYTKSDRAICRSKDNIARSVTNQQINTQLSNLVERFDNTDIFPERSYSKLNQSIHLIWRPFNFNNWILMDPGIHRQNK